MTRFYLTSTDKYYDIEESKIWDFPIGDTFLQALLRQKEFVIPMKEDAIIINTPLKYFDYIVDIYNNPTYLLSQILDKDFQILMTLFNRFDETTKYNDLEDWVIFQDMTLLEHLKNSIFDECNYKEFKSELKYFGIWPLYSSSKLCENVYNKLPEKLNEKVLQIGGYSSSRELSENVYNKLPKKLNEKVLQIGGYISGSCLLNIVTCDTHWKSSDVDIYIHRNMVKGMDFDSIVNFFEGSNMEVITKNNPRYDHHYENHCDCLGNCINNVLYILKFKIGELNVDLICVKIPVPIFIFNNFDFSFLKMYSDGISLHIFDKKSVLNRKATLNCVCFNTMKKRERLRKYHERGFIVTFNFEHREILHENDEEYPYISKDLIFINSVLQER